MSDFSTEAPSIFSNLQMAAKAGDLTVELEPSEFVKLEHACLEFAAEIRRIQEQILTAGNQSADWGLGEKNPRLTSAQILVGRFVQLAAVPQGNSAYAVLEEHYQVVEEIRGMFATIRESYMRADADFAATVRALDPTLANADR